jgi:WD40 repeat protein
VKITPDGKYAVSVSEDRTVKVWNLSTGQSVATFTGELAMRSCVVGRDGRTLAARDSLGRVHFLQLEEV